MLVRIAEIELRRLRILLFRRYPDFEWAAFLRLGWRETESGLVLTLAFIDEPLIDELDERVGHVAIQEPYTLRIALLAETHPLAVGVIHSHPENCPPIPSVVDDDMDHYYASYFADFAPSRPYASLIMSQMESKLAISGRVHWRGQWHTVERFALELTSAITWRSTSPVKKNLPCKRQARLTSAFGQESAAYLREATVAVIGAGGTGSSAIEVLARAGVGHVIVVDPDYLEESNLERVHGSIPEHAQSSTSKAQIALEHLRAIDPNCRVTALIGGLPQPAVLDAVVTADVVLGCTDQQHSRLALSDLAYRYNIPAIDCGVAMEGSNGSVTGQIIQLVRFLANDACVYCRSMVSAQRLAQELMSPEERVQRQHAAQVAIAQGLPGNGYWKDMPQLNTVGYLTTMAGAMAAGYAIGWVTHRFMPPFSRLQMNLVAQYLDVTNDEQSPRPDCICQRIRGWADQGGTDALMSVPCHWPTVTTLRHDPK